MEKTAYSIDNITENGKALAHIVTAGDGGQLLDYAAEELAYHIKKVSGAAVPVVHEEAEGSLPILIGTPETLPELEALFPEDLAWLRVLSDGNGRVWGADGFSIRLHGGKIYIFGAIAKGALNGVYDFIEKNMGVIWVRANDDHGIIYEAMPTIPVTKTDYREKSPYTVRGWHACAHDVNNPLHYILMGRSKMNIKSGRGMERMGIDLLGVAHNVKWRVQNSPLYDPSVTEYWNTDENGAPGTFETSAQINFFSHKTAEAVAASVVEHLKAGVAYPFIGIEDTTNFGMNGGLETKPFEYAPGQFVDPEAGEYRSTVYFTFINKVARMVKKEVPDGKIATFAYFFTEPTPLCALEDNVLIVMAPIRENLSFAYDDPRSENNSDILRRMEAWRAKGAKMVFYNYYGCFRPSDRYTRPVWDSIRDHLRYYRDCGFAGMLPEGVGDDGSHETWYYTGERKQALGHNDYEESRDPSLTPVNYRVWEMNGLIFWLYAKLSWNPDLDVDALIVEYCDKVYGAASAAMQEYYRLIKLGWDAGRDDLPFEYTWGIGWTHLMECYLFNKKFDDNPAARNLVGRILGTLDKAMAQADDRAKVHIRPILERMEKTVEEYKEFLVRYPDAAVGTHTPNIVRE